MDQVQRFVEVLCGCRGLIWLTGVGKSGLVARLVSTMLVSIGYRSMFVSPVDAAHGDVGAFRQDDVFVCISKSGESDEFDHLVPAARRKGVSVVALVSSADSRLARAADTVIELPLRRELCPFDLAPTTSTCVQLAFGNTVVAALMQHTKTLSREAYAVNHPAGRIGRRLNMLVSDVMQPASKLAFCTPSDALITVLPTISAARCGCVLIVGGDSANDTATSKKTLVGIFTDGDLRRTIEKSGADALNQPMGSFMKRNPATVSPATNAFAAMQEMERSDPVSGKKRVKELPVVDPANNNVVGLLLLHDLVQKGL